MASHVKKAKGESSRKPNWLELPIDITKNILQRLDTDDIVTSARNVCPLWWNICKDPLMWRTIYINYDISCFDSHCLEKICRCAIDLSCGHVEDIAIYAFGTNELLKYMAHRASNLRRLQIVYCNDISNEGLIEFVKMFSLLEELRITFRYLSKDTLEVIGRHCPFLKSLNLEKQMSRLNKKFSKQVLAISKTMSGLRHLGLSGIFIGNNELLAILDCCPLLDSLYLPYCYYHHSTSQSFLKWCRLRIKDLQHPNLGRYFENDDILVYLDTFEDTYANDDWEY